MKTRTRRILIVFGAIIGALIVLRVGLALVWPTINDVRTGATPEYPARWRGQRPVEIARR